MELILQTIVNGLMASAFYALISVGLTLVFGVMNIANFAHGEMYMLGAYTVWLLYAEANWPFFGAVIAAILIVSAFGIITERFLFRRVKGNTLNGFIISIGLVFILQVSAGQIFGVGMMKPVPKLFPGTINYFGVFIGTQRFLVIPITIIILGLLWLFLGRFKMGRALRAASQDPETASLQGISVNTSSAVAMGLGGAMAGAAGALMAPLVSVHPYMGHSVVWTAFVIVIVGGPGNIKGTILAAAFFGFLHTVVGTFLDSTIANIMGVLCMLVILSIKPEGLLGDADA